MDQGRRKLGPSEPGRRRAMLTPRQSDCLGVPREIIRRTRIRPSFEGEMLTALNGRQASSNIHRLLDALEERGFIRRLRRGSRAIRGVRMPKNPKGRRTVAGSVNKAYSSSDGWGADPEVLSSLRRGRSATCSVRLGRRGSIATAASARKRTEMDRVTFTPRN